MEFDVSKMLLIMLQNIVSRQKSSFSGIRSVTMRKRAKYLHKWQMAALSGVSFTREWQDIVVKGNLINIFTFLCLSFFSLCVLSWDVLLSFSLFLECCFLEECSWTGMRVTGGLSRRRTTSANSFLSAISRAVSPCCWTEKKNGN